MAARRLLLVVAIVALIALGLALLVILAPALVLLHANGRMIGRHWRLPDQPPPRSEGSAQRRRLIGELGAAAAAGWLAGRRR